MNAMLKTLIVGSILVLTTAAQAQSQQTREGRADRRADRQADRREDRAGQGAREGRFENRRGMPRAHRRIVKGDKVMTTSHEILIAGDVFPDGFLKLYTTTGSFYRSGNISQLAHYSECAGDFCKSDKVMTTSHEILVVGDIFPDGFVKLYTTTGSFYRSGNISQLAHFSECSDDFCKGDKVMTTSHEILVVGDVFPDGFVKLYTTTGSFYRSGNTNQLANFSECAKNFCKSDKVMTTSHEILVIGEIFPDGFVKLYTEMGSFYRSGNASELSLATPEGRGRDRVRDRRN